MPQIPDSFLRSVVVLLDQFGRPKGSAFVLRSGGPGAPAGQDCFLVTCQHCIDVAAKARFANGYVLPVKKKDWLVPTLVDDDIAALDISDTYDSFQGQVGHLDFQLGVGDDDPNYGLGVDLYMLGLLLDVDDIGENVPRARFGNLSAFANPKVPLMQGNDKERPCHLGDMRSRTGFSGAPVFAYIDIAAWGGRPKTEARLIGMHSAQHRERIDLFSHDKFTKAEIASSMTRIVPASSIWTFLLTDNAVKAARAKARGLRG